MDPNLDDMDAGLIDQMASQQMGVAPQIAPPAEQQAPAQQPPAKPTPQEAATANVAPKTEATQAKADPFEFFDAGNGKIYTPDLTSCLAGITRDTVMQLAAELGIEVIEKRITRDEVYIADEAFFTGTAAEVTPIRELDGRAIGEGRRGPITEKIQSAFFDIVQGRNPKYAHWLTPVAA